MALREVLRFPDKRLAEVSEPIEEITDEIRVLAEDMLDVMYDEPGIGLAAPQVGETVRLIVVDTEWTEEDAEKSPLVLVNPEIVEREGKLSWTEGCLSVPDYQAEVERAERVRLLLTFDLSKDSLGGMVGGKCGLIPCTNIPATTPAGMGRRR
jgi:peptide deformylase